MKVMNTGLEKQLAATAGFAIGSPMLLPVNGQDKQ